jgi:hypothetical protein
MHDVKRMAALHDCVDRQPIHVIVSLDCHCHWSDSAEEQQSEYCCIDLDLSFAHSVILYGDGTVVNSTLREDAVESVRLDLLLSNSCVLSDRQISFFGIT